RQPRWDRDQSRFAGRRKDRPEPDPGDPQQRSSAESSGSYSQRTKDDLRRRGGGARPDRGSAGVHLAEPGTQAGVGPGGGAIQERCGSQSLAVASHAESVALVITMRKTTILMSAL